MTLPVVCSQDRSSTLPGRAAWLVSVPSWGFWTSLEVLFLVTFPFWFSLNYQGANTLIFEFSI